LSAEKYQNEVPAYPTRPSRNKTGHDFFGGRGDRLTHARKARKIPPMRNRPNNRVVVSTPESYAIRAKIGISAKQQAERATSA